MRLTSGVPETYKKYTNCYRYTYVAFVDMAKAFDRGCIKNLEEIYELL